MVKEIEKFLDYIEFERGCAINTVRTYATALFLINDFLKSPDIKDVTKNDIIDFLGSLHQKKSTRGTIANRIAVFKSFWKWAYREDLVRNNIGERLFFPKQKPERKPKFLTVQQIDKFFDFDLYSLKDYRDRAMLEFLFSTGCRVSELINADIRRTDLDEGELIVRGGKGDDRVIYLTKTCVKWIKKYLNFRKELFGELTEPLFISQRNPPPPEVGAWICPIGAFNT